MDISKNIESANNWLKENRTDVKPITLDDVKNRLKKPNFLGISSTKTVKGETLNYLTAILYLAPYKICGFNMCSMAKTCILDCLFNSGRGRFNSVTRSRIIKTLCFLYDKKEFVNVINKDILRLEKKAKNKGFKLCVRINGTSDLNIGYYFKDTLQKYSDIQFYDYTKVFNFVAKNKFKNYHFTFSYDGTNLDNCKTLLKLGYNVSIVFLNELPKTFLGYKVINADKTDLRFLDEKNVICGLTYKKVNNKDINPKFVISC